MFQPPPLPRKYDACVRDLASAKADVRASAVQDIVRYARDEGHRKEAIALLQKALTDESARVRSHAAIALSDVGCTDAVPALLVRIEDDDPHVRQMAITALGELKDARAAARLARALRDERPEVRYQSVIAYARVAAEPEEVAVALAKAMEDDDFNVRYIAARLAEEHGVDHDDVRDRAAALLDDAEHDVAVAAAIFLTKAGDERGHALVLDVVRGDARAQKEDEREAVEASGVAGLRDATAALERRAFGLVSKVRDTCSFHALIALARMDHGRAVDAILADLASSSPKRRAAGVVAAGRARLARARATIEAMTDIEETLRSEALAALTE